MCVLQRFCILLVFLSGLIHSGCTGSSTAGNPDRVVADSLKEVSRDLLVQGALSAVKGDYQDAIGQYRKALVAEPKNAAVNFSLAKAFVALTKPDSAQYHAEKAVTLQPENRFYRQLLAGIYFDMKYYDRAAVQFEQLAERFPSKTKTLFFLAHAYLADEKYADALNTFLRILQHDPSNENARIQSLWLELKLERYDAAIKNVEYMIREKGDNDKLQLTRGELYYQSGKVMKAKEIFRSILGGNPAFIPAWIALIEAHIEQDEEELYVKELRRFYGIDSIGFFPKAEFVKAFMVRSEKDLSYSEAVGTMVEELVSFYPSESTVYVLRGMFLRVQKRYRDAGADFLRALEIDSHNIFAWEEYASAYMSQEDYEQVVSTVSQARKRTGRSSLRLDVFEGYALFRSENLRKSVDVLEKALSSEIEDKPSWLLVQAHITLAMAYDRLQDQLKSISAYKDVLSLDPENALALNNLAYLYAERGENLNEAIEYAKTAVESDPDNPVYLDTLGWLYYKTGEYGKAREYLEKALAKDPDEPEIYDHLAEIYRALGKETRAKEFREKADELRGGEAEERQK
ncbi:MAG: tetratricopeptide repeat protein [Chlorobium phaeobacteroides]|uniref:Tetratricopeptide TPR_2 repeat protein n=1 Tax=Chlorobium phaeobacteroides (strain BS1) TaxID=331678 RepID=B3EMR9_CHLPB|nr:tetratricopeptide repeat protein [Chlorobium phaeobacteroides]